MRLRCKQPIRSVSLVGAGVMGCSVAEVIARAGLTVRLSDQVPDVAASKVAKLQSVVANPQAISVAASDADIAASDLIVETIPENHDLKVRFLSRIESFLRDDSIIASNTSSLSITRLSAALRNPHRFCGLHFCYPVNERPLVEIIRAEDTAAETIDRSMAFAQTIGLAPLSVRDSPGFLLNRLLVPYMNETLELLLRGTDVATLDQAAKTFGMPLRPLELFDNFGLDVALAVGRSLYQAWPDRISSSELLIAMYKSGRRGRKSGGGFYLSAEDARDGRIDPNVLDLIKQRQRAQETFTVDIVTKRLFLPMLLEATRTLEESLVADPQTIDTTLKNGLGLNNEHGGLMAWANSIGSRKIAKWLEPFEPLGESFQPTDLLLEAARHDAPLDRRRDIAA